MRRVVTLAGLCMALLLVVFAGTALAKTINGNDGRNTLIGIDRSDVIRGFGGDDVLRGRGGNDVLIGGLATTRWSAAGVVTPSTPSTGQVATSSSAAPGSTRSGQTWAT